MRAPKASWEVATAPPAMPNQPQHPHTLSFSPRQSYICSTGFFLKKLDTEGEEEAQKERKEAPKLSWVLARASSQYFCVWKTNHCNPKAEILKIGTLQNQTLHLRAALVRVVKTSLSWKNSNLNMGFLVVKWICHQNCWVTDQSRGFGDFESLNQGWKWKESSLCLGWF